MDEHGMADVIYDGRTETARHERLPGKSGARWAKLAMTVQAVGSLMILGLVIARAANILK